jgi:quinoprotein glucose dehydrogenase
MRTKNKNRLFGPTSLIATYLIFLFIVPLPLRAADYRAWKTYGGSPDQIRYSRLKQINRANVKGLTVAWTYDTLEGGDLQTQPIVVDGVLYAYTPTHKTIALDAATGKLLWTFDSGLEGKGANRGVMYWQRGRDKRVFAAVDEYLYALDARTGQAIETFADKGRIDLRQGLGRDPQTQSVRLTTPGVIYKDLLIVGGRVSEGLPASPGSVRAYDVRTGALRWTFHTIPQPGEFGHDTWPKDAWTYIGGANSWPGMTLDERRGVVFVPTGSAAADFYGGNRLGDNLFANSLLALKADTGERLWHFQFVRHDILDRDLPAPPALVTVRRGGRKIQAIAQTTKPGFVYLFDRDDGTPLFTLEYTKVPSSNVPGEVAADSQPVPTKPAAYARQVLTADMLTNRTPQSASWAREQFSKMKSEGPFAPLEIGKDTAIFPGLDGGAEWGGAAFDPQTGLLYINSNEMAWLGSLAPNDEGRSARSVYLRECAVCHGDNLQGAPPSIPSLVDIAATKTADEISTAILNGGGRMPAFANLQKEALQAIVAYLVSGENTETDASQPNMGRPAYRFTGYRRWLDPEGYPAVAPPWGTLNAIDLDTGEFVWRIPFGEFPELAAQGLVNTGSENYGGPIVTAGGLLFIGATNHDRKFRAFDKTNGELLWETTLPFSANATPATYELKGRQYVVVLATGGKSREAPGGVYVAFALPK